MKCVVSICVVVGLFGVTTSKGAVGMPAPGKSGIWSKKAISLDPKFGSNGTRDITVFAPNGTLRLVVGNIYISIYRNQKQLRIVRPRNANMYNKAVGVGSLAEVQWAPDSRAFYITQSDGGILGTWYTIIYLIRQNQVVPLDVSSQVKQRFEKTYSCQDGTEAPNIAGVAWTQHSSALLVVAEVPPHSSCPDMGRQYGYIVKIPSGDVIKKLSYGDLLKNWNQFLGVRIKK